MASSRVSHFSLSTLGGCHREHVSSHSYTSAHDTMHTRLRLLPGHRLQRVSHIVARGNAALHELKVVLLWNDRGRRRTSTSLHSEVEAAGRAAQIKVQSTQTSQRLHTLARASPSQCWTCRVALSLLLPSNTMVTSSEADSCTNALLPFFNCLIYFFNE